MAMGIMSLLCSFLAVLTTATVSGSDHDEAALLAFRAQVSDGGSLASWNSSASFCSWEGVTCSHRRPARVVALRLNNKALAGELSPAIGNLTFLRTLNLSFNWLHGEIPASLGRLRRLHRLDLGDNSFSGTLPVNLSSCVSMAIMGLLNNKLGGRIPAELGEKLTSLVRISLSNNSFTGLIPPSLANLSHLEILDLSRNQLVGSIPPRLGSIQGMQQFSIARNLINVIVLVWRLCKKLKSSQNAVAKDSIVDGHYRRIPYPALLKGTNEFSEANLLGKGSYGAVYKCVLDNEETELAVKVFNLGRSRYSKSFEAECEAMRRIRHRCLIKIITSCSSINHQGQEFKALVFEFMPNGNLDSWLHQPSQDPTANNTLSLAQRFDIAVDIVDAVEYLHRYCQPLVIHCDIKPSNILLAEDMSARVGDFGISRILQENTSEGMQSSYGSTGIKGSIGYVAPEYGEGSAVSTAGDIYSLGILLLEMFTGRSPTEGMFRDSLDLHKFVEDALQDRTLEIADPTMWLHSGQWDNTTSIRIMELLVSVFRLGISCSRQHPRDRTTTGDAAAEMHAIRDAYLKFIGEHGAETEASTEEIQNSVA
uniref:Receptor kinase-like protein Xa21 n=1 Tax=Hordeum vulgare subsp. vulgare TaxID=112509 RepID=A0A8I7BG37_HORVV